MCLGSGKQPLPISKLDVPQYSRTYIGVLPHLPWALVHCMELPLLQSHSKRVLLFGEIWDGMRLPSFPYQGKAAHSQFIKPGKICHYQTQPPSIWKLPGSTGQPTQWVYSSTNASVLSRATLAYIPPRLCQEFYFTNQFATLTSLSKRLVQEF